MGLIFREAICLFCGHEKDCHNDGEVDLSTGSKYCIDCKDYCEQEEYPKEGD